ncbi:plasmid pRiA4b ORF-3 family protein [Bacillus sp. REN10]|uniref:plasmid pRiA4b ORF-3 family protein n=1 Tax=Bacillus sp. REN10 TaxID=2782541 RepID=UPI00193B3233|nr:plasmid pRiA4b ORF-3 family protein [Bacillus sp. REN10]
MKAYIIKLTFEDVEPVVWRRVVLPADATFHRLHETIQHVTNFQSELEPYHSFGVEIGEWFVTNNEVLQSEKHVKQPSRIKIDPYLERDGSFIYDYDFGDNWRIKVELEETVDDYYFGFPTLLEGEGTAPPEDAGGPFGYKEFLKVYHDPTHPEFLQTVAWAEKQRYVPLDIDYINDSLKYVKYKKTEWSKIDHKNYVIISDQYRRSDFIDLDDIPNKELICQYAIACVHLYGLIDYSKFLEIYNGQNEPALSRKELMAILKDPHYAMQMEEADVFIHDQAFIHHAIELFDDYANFYVETLGKPFYVPEKEELLRYVDDFYIERTPEQDKLARMLAKDFFGGSTLMVHEEIEELVTYLQASQSDFQLTVQQFLQRFEFKDMKQLNEYVRVITAIANTTRIWENRGHTPKELAEMEKHYLIPLPNQSVTTAGTGKVGRNEKCPCGSGKKYKKCCGK